MPPPATAPCRPGLPHSTHSGGPGRACSTAPRLVCAGGALGTSSTPSAAPSSPALPRGCARQRSAAGQRARTRRPASKLRLPPRDAARPAAGPRSTRSIRERRRQAARAPGLRDAARAVTVRAGAAAGAPGAVRARAPGRGPGRTWEVTACQPSASSPRWSAEPSARASATSSRSSWFTCARSLLARAPAAVSRSPSRSRAPRQRWQRRAVRRAPPAARRRRGTACGTAGTPPWSAAACSGSAGTRCALRAGAALSEPHALPTPAVARLCRAQVSCAAGQAELNSPRSGRTASAHRIAASRDLQGAAHHSPLSTAQAERRRGAGAAQVRGRAGPHLRTRPGRLCRCSTAAARCRSSWALCARLNRCFQAHQRCSRSGGVSRSAIEVQ